MCIYIQVLCESGNTSGVFDRLSRYSCLLCQCSLVQYGPLWPISRDEPLQADVNVPDTRAALCTWLCTWHTGRLPSGCLRLQHSSLSSSIICGSILLPRLGMVGQQHALQLISFRSQSKLQLVGVFGEGWALGGHG